MCVRTTWVYLVLVSIFAACQGCATRHARVLANLPDPILSVADNGGSPQPYSNQEVTHKTTARPARSRHISYQDNIPASWYPQHAERPWQAIVIHHSAGENGCAKAFDRMHRTRGWDELGYHFVINNGSDRPDGLVEIGSRWKIQKHGAHCKTPDNFYNEYGIGICLVGNFENHAPTARQMRSLRKLVLFLSLRYDIASDHVYGHGDIGHTKCPGRYLSVRKLATWLEGKRRAWAMLSR